MLYWGSFDANIITVDRQFVSNWCVCVCEGDESGIYCTEFLFYIIEASLKSLLS